MPAFRATGDYSISKSLDLRLMEPLCVVAATGFACLWEVGGAAAAQRPVGGQQGKSGHDGQRKVVATKQLQAFIG